MAFKINISDKGKTFHLETELESLVGKRIGDKISGGDVSGDLSGYELQITGTSDKAGFPGAADVQGIALKQLLLKKGKFLKRVPHKGFRRKKTVRGNQISSATVQINMVVVKEGGKKLEEVFGGGKEEVKEEKPEEKKEKN